MMGTESSIQRELKVHRMVQSRLVELGIQDGRIGEITAGLGDLYGAFDTGTHLIDHFLSPTVDREKAADILIDFRTELRHIEGHIRSLKRPLEALIDTLYGDDGDGQ